MKFAAAAADSGSVKSAVESVRAAAAVGVEPVVFVFVDDDGFVVMGYYDDAADAGDYVDGDVDGYYYRYYHFQQHLHYLR